MATRLPRRIPGPGPAAPAQRFRISEQWILRRGCGNGIRQSHAVGTLEWRPESRPPDWSWMAYLDPWLDEPAFRLPPDARVGDIAKWMTVTLGALLRSAGIASARDVHVVPVDEAGNQRVHRCRMAVPFVPGGATARTIQWLLSCLNDPPRDEERMRARFFELFDVLLPLAGASRNQWQILQAALDGRYPVVPAAPGVLCVGSGVHRRWFGGLATDRTSSISMRLAKDKHQTAGFLRGHGFPGAVNRLVDSPERLRAAARELGYPLVVKPNDQDRGVGVTAEIVSEADLLAAWELARRHSPRVLVEKHQPGFTHRLTVVQGRIVRVTKLSAFGVTGDGRSNVEQLAAARARDFDAQKRARRVGVPIGDLDEEALGLLRQYGFDRQHVPAAGEYVRLRRRDNVSRGGWRITLETREVHPDNLRLAIDVTAMLNLDIAGIDLISPDIGRSWRDLPATICEVNGNPQLVERDNPALYRDLLRELVPAPARVPTTVLLELAAPAQDARERLVREYSPPGSGCGLSMAAGLWLDGAFISGPFGNGHAAAASLTMHPGAQRMAHVMTVDEVLRDGIVTGEIDTVRLPAALPEGLAAQRRSDFRKALDVLRPHAGGLVPPESAS